MSVANGDVIFESVNVVIRNGQGSTASTSGKGNLVVGYNEATGTRDRSGSHNIVVGPDHEFSSHSGIVTGEKHVISGRCAVGILVRCVRLM